MAVESVLTAEDHLTPGGSLDAEHERDGPPPVLGVKEAGGLPRMERRQSLGAAEGLDVAVDDAVQPLLIGGG